MSEYYVYGLFVDHIIIYVGKGKGNRKNNHLHTMMKHDKAVNKVLYYKLRNAINNNQQITSNIIYNNLSEQQALQIEQNLILHYGRKIDKTGPLCNVAPGGNQPISVVEFCKLFGKDRFLEVKDKQKKTFRDTINKRIHQHKHIIEKMLANGCMLKEIATALNITMPTARKWIKLNKIQMNYKGKQNKLKDHLHKWRQINKLTPNKVAKQYTIKEPNGNIIITRQLKQYCSQHNIDYSNLRSAFKRNGTCSGYSIIKQQEPCEL